MRDEFFRKVPSMRDEFNHFYPSLRDFYAYYGVRVYMPRWNLHGIIIGKHSKLLPKSANLRLRKQKIWQINGKICKNHEEKHEIDVKENEKTCGHHAQNIGTEAKKQAFFVAQIGGGQKWAPHLFRLKSIFYQNAKKQNLLPFLNSYYYQNSCRADSFQHLYINNARKVR